MAAGYGHSEGVVRIHSVEIFVREVEPLLVDFEHWVGLLRFLQVRAVGCEALQFLLKGFSTASAGLLVLQ